MYMRIFGMKSLKVNLKKSSLKSTTGWPKTKFATSNCFSSIICLLDPISLFSCLFTIFKAFQTNFGQKCNFKLANIAVGHPVSRVYVLIRSVLSSRGDLRACFENSSNNSSRSLFFGMLPTKRRWLLKDMVTPILFPFRSS